MKRVFKHIAIIFPIALGVFLISFAVEDKTLYKYTSTYEEQPAVFVTKYGDCFHSGSCHYLSQSRIEKGLHEAIISGYRPCTHCDGKSYRTIQVEHREYYEVTSYRNAIIFSSIRMLLITPIIYLTGYVLLRFKLDT